MITIFPFFGKPCNDLSFGELASMIRAGGTQRERAIKCLIKRLRTIRYGKDTLAKFVSLETNDFDFAFADAIVDLDTLIRSVDKADSEEDSGQYFDPEKIPSMVKTFFFRNLIDILRKQTNKQGKTLKLTPAELELLKLSTEIDEDKLFSEPDPCLVLAFSRLGLRCRTLLTEYYYLELTLEEIALLYYAENRNVAAVSLYNCRQALQRILIALCENPGAICKDICAKYIK